MRNFAAGVVASIVAAGLGAMFTLVVVLPRLNWGADQKPSWLEAALAGRTLNSWVARGAPAEVNPLQATSDNLKDARNEYGEHCAVCHGLDGSGNNRLEAVFYPAVPKLTGDTQKLTDGQIYFIVSKGIGNTAMPSFERTHSVEDIWRTVLWVRHLTQLTPQEKSALQQEMQSLREEHEENMAE